MNKTIVELAEKYDTDKKINLGVKCKSGLTGKNYAIYYDKLLKTLDVKKMLEIGVSFGSSIKMWGEYFNSDVNIYAIDINEQRFNKEELEKQKNIKIFIGDQGNKKFLDSFSTNIFDFIVDDGSHRMKHQQFSFKELFKYVRNGGIYVIEDLHTSKNDLYYDSENEVTTLEVLKALKNKKIIKSNYINEQEYYELLNNIDDINFYSKDRICFIKKK